MSTDEESVEAGGAEFHEITVGAQARFAYGDAVVRNPADQFEGGFDADGERPEVAIVNPDDARAGGEGAVKFWGGVNFDERFHAQLAAQRDEVAKESVFKRGDDEQKTICVVGAGFPYLPGIEDKIFAQNGEPDGLPGVAEIFQRATKEFGLGENRERAGTRGFQRLRKSQGIERIAEDTTRRRGWLELRKNIQSVATERCGKIPQGRGCLHAILQGGLWQDALALINFDAARLQNPIKDGSGVGVGRHEDNFVC